MEEREEEKSQGETEEHKAATRTQEKARAWPELLIYQYVHKYQSVYSISIHISADRYRSTVTSEAGQLSITNYYQKLTYRKLS